MLSSFNHIIDGVHVVLIVDETFGIIEKKRAFRTLIQWLTCTEHVTNYNYLLFHERYTYTLHTHWQNRMKKPGSEWLSLIWTQCAWELQGPNMELNMPIL